MTVYRFVQVWPEITSPAWEMVAVPPQLSVEIIPAVDGTGTKLAHCTDTLAGQLLMDGAVLSKTVIV